MIVSSVSSVSIFLYPRYIQYRAYTTSSVVEKVTFLLLLRKGRHKAHGFPIPEYYQALNPVCRFCADQAPARKTVKRRIRQNTSLYSETANAKNFALVSFRLARLMH